jgi:hypothetical protein
MAVRNEIPCRRCGAVIEPGKKFCSQCGSPRGATVSGPPATSARRLNICPECSFENHHSDLLCKGCGAQLADSPAVLASRDLTQPGAIAPPPLEKVVKTDATEPSVANQQPLNSGTDGAGPLFMPAATPSLVPSAGAGAIPAHGPSTRMDMSGKSDQFAWTSYWRLAWGQRPSAKVLSPVRALLAVAAAAVQFLYFANFRPFNEKLTVAVIIVAVYTVLYAIEAAWNFIFIAPVRLDEARRRQAKTDAIKIYCLQSELQEATERLRPKIGFQLKSGRSGRVPTGTNGQSGLERGTFSPLSLDVWNEGQTHVQVNTLRLENVANQKRRTVEVNTVLVPSLPPQTVDITAELSAFLAEAPASGPTANWDAAAGAHHIAVSLQYEGGGTSAETETKNYQVQSSETTPWLVKISRES